MIIFTQIVFENRKRNLPFFNDCLLCVDCTDFGVLNLGSAFSSHKLKGKSAVRYEIALDILKGDIPWIYGPLSAGHWPDVKIFCHSLRQWVDEMSVLRQMMDMLVKHAGN